DCSRHFPCLAAACCSVQSALVWDLLAQAPNVHQVGSSHAQPIDDHNERQDFSPMLDRIGPFENLTLVGGDSVVFHDVERRVFVAHQEITISRHPEDDDCEGGPRPNVCGEIHGSPPAGNTGICYLWPGRNVHYYDNACTLPEHHRPVCDGAHTSLEAPIRRGSAIHAPLAERRYSH